MNLVPQTKFGQRRVGKARPEGPDTGRRREKEAFRRADCSRWLAQSAAAFRFHTLADG